MEVENSDNFSFLSLLMAPEENDHFTLPYPSSDFTPQQQQTPQNYDSMPSFDINFQNPENMSDYLLPISSSFDYYFNDYDYIQPTNSNTNTQFLPPLPELLSYENTTIDPPSNGYIPSPLPKLVSPLPEKDDYTLGSIVANHCKPTKPTQKRGKRRKQSKISEKVYNLGKLLPGGYKRKCYADILEEAYKYIKFLQVQLKVLQSMEGIPSAAVGVSGGGNNVGGNDKVGCKRCRCSEEDEVGVNSEAAKVVMADKGWCLVSEEQVEYINRVVAREKIVDHILSSISL